MRRHALDSVRCDRRSLAVLLGLAACWSPAGALAQDAAPGGEEEPAPTSAPVEAPPPAPAPTEPAPAEPAPTPDATDEAAAAEPGPQRQAEFWNAPPPPPPSPPPSPSPDAAGEVGAEARERGWRRWFDVDAEALTLGLYLNDADFDRSEPAYDENGQHVGLVGTQLRAGITFNAATWLRIRYMAELGLNIWSRNNADEIDPTAEDIFLLLHREVYAEGELAAGRFQFRLGYGYTDDPTGLFIGHWMGAVRLATTFRGWTAELMGGLLPDATFEGWDMIENNFTHDVVAFGLSFEGPLVADTLGLAVGAYGLVDSREVRHRVGLAAPFARFDLTLGRVALGLEGMLQVGSRENGTLDLEDQLHLAWALGHDGEALLLGERLRLSWHLLVLSADGPDEGSDRNTGFLYSGRSRSPTLWLTENELRDFLSNFDERVGAERGAHFLMRPGLALVDASLGYRVVDWFEPSLVVGVATVLEPDNALGGTLVGVETSLDLAFAYRELLEAHLIGSVLVPGGAGGALVNAIDRDATDVVGGVLATVAVRY